MGTTKIASQKQKSNPDEFVCADEVSSALAEWAAKKPEWMPQDVHAGLGTLQRLRADGLPWVSRIDADGAVFLALRELSRCHRGNALGWRWAVVATIEAAIDRYLGDVVERREARRG